MSAECIDFSDSVTVHGCNVCACGVCVRVCVFVMCALYDSIAFTCDVYCPL